MKYCVGSSFVVGMEYFDVDLSYRVEATWKPHSEPITLKVPTAIGEDEDQTSYGSIEFELQGQVRSGVTPEA